MEIDGETVETVSDFIFLGSKITADGDCSHEIKRHVLLGRKVMANLDSMLKIRDIILPTKVHLVSSVQFSSVAQSCPTLCDPMDGCTPSNEYSELISFRMDWLDLLAVQGILKSLLQHHSSKASILQCSAFCIVQLSHPYVTTRKTFGKATGKALTRWTFVGKVMSLLFNMLSRLAITFLPRSKFFISWLQSLSAVIFSSVQSLSLV